nr:diguanylate cyclase [Kineococcus vitellinus]
MAAVAAALAEPAAGPAVEPAAEPAAEEAAEPAAGPAAEPVAALDAALGDALAQDRRCGTGTGLLLVSLDARAGASADPAAVVRRARRAARSRDRWFPLAADRFAVLLTGLPAGGCEAVVERVADALLLAVESSPSTAPELGVRLSIGASLAPDRARSAEQAREQAGAALEAARRAGGHCARIWPV